MKINAKLHYGLKAMIELAMNSGERGILQKDLAEKQCIPNKFMDAIIHDLKVAGLIINFAGKSSGYKLNKKPNEITIYDIYRAFEPKLQIHFCLADLEVCPRTCFCASRQFFDQFNKEMESFMLANTLEKLVKNQNELNKGL
jgi:Rrf2 family protein